MDTLNQQVIALNHKVDRLYEIVMQVNDKLAELTATPLQDHHISPLEPTHHQSLTRPHLTSESRLEHKDVLSDDDYITTKVMIHREEPNITADLQVTRLTAQLTAAYNRIAALEEQLLATRIHY